LAHRGTEITEGDELSALSGAVLDEALSIHREVGSALLESVYELVLAAALERRGLRVQRQVPVDIEYRDLRFARAFRIDLLIEGRLIVEVKSVERLLPVHAKQTLTYLKLMNLRLGLLVNFGGETLKGNVKRLING
jgi:GxxExxY protein